MLGRLLAIHEFHYEHPGQLMSQCLMRSFCKFCCPLRQLLCIWSSLFLVILAAYSSSAVAFEAGIALKQYHHQAWGAREGAPSEAWTIAQTTDGVLWLGGAFGLTKFDGIKFEPFMAPVGQPQPNVGVFVIAASSSGDLWVANTQRGLSRIRNGQLEAVTEAGLADVPIYFINEGPGGSVWAANDKSVFRFDGTRWSRVGRDWSLTIRRLLTFAVDGVGTVWLCDDGILKSLDAHSRNFTVAEQGCDGIRSMQGADNGVWMFSDNSVKFIKGANRAQPIEAGGWMLRKGQFRLIDKDGHYWSIYCPEGVCRSSRAGSFEQPLLDRYTSQEGLTSDFVMVMFEDQEGSVWAATKRGIDRFRRAPFAAVNAPRSLNNFGLAPEGDGSVSMSAIGQVGNALFRASRDLVEVPAPAGLSAVTALTRAKDGTLWLGLVDGLAKRQRGGFVRVDVPASARGETVRQLLDLGDELWVVFPDVGVFALSSAGWREVFSSQGEAVRWSWLARDAQGAIWAAGRSNRLLQLSGSPAKSLGPAQGMAIGDASFAYGGTKRIFIAGDRGVVVKDGDRLVPLRLDDDALLSGVTGIVETAKEGDVWLNGRKGAVRVSSAALDAYLEGREKLLQYKQFDVFDGYPGQSATPFPKPSVVEGTDGRIWFSGNAGVAWLDPSKVQTNSVAPQTRVLSLGTPTRTYEPAGALQLPKGTTSVHFHYSAASLTVPERVQFQYRLDGLDTAWMNAGTQREASFANLGPGQYSFRVKAANNDGKWGPEAALPFEVEAAFYQTTWFKVLCALAVLALLWMLYQLRLETMIRRAGERTIERVSERERIARELHDTLLQGVQGLILRFHVNLGQLPSDHPGRKAMDDDLTLADNVLKDSRARVLALRASGQPSMSLSFELEEAAGQLAQNYESDWELHVEGEVRPIKRAVHEEIRMIFGEALLNAFRHSGASKLDLTVTFGRFWLVVELVDNGSGMSKELLERGRRGHLGLTSMRERARLSGARLSIESTVGAGTRVTLRLSARRAYAARR